MGTMQTQRLGRSARASQRGVALLLAMLATILVLTLGLAMLEVSHIDQVRSEREMESVEAVAAAELGLARARAMSYSQKVAWVGMKYNGVQVAFNYSSNPAYSGHQVCTLFTNQPVGGNSVATYSVVIEDLTGVLISSGTYRVHAYGMCGPYTRHVYMDAQTLTFGSFLWFTNNENGVYFTTGDYLDGFLYSNGILNLNGTPVFAKRAYSAASSVNYSGGSTAASFQGGLTLNAPTIAMSSVFADGQLTSVRTASKATGGVWQAYNSGYGYDLTFNSNGTFTIQKADRRGRWTTVVNNQSVASTNGAFYFEDDVQVHGVLNGQVTVGTSLGKDITITDDIYYAYPSSVSSIFATGFDPTVSAFNDKLALISGNDIVINKNWSGSWTNMYITALLAAPEGTIKNAYYTSTPQKTLNIWGGLTQDTRGAVGQIGGIGFLKNYRYDTRFLLSPPPAVPQIGYTFQAWNLDS